MDAELLRFLGSTAGLGLVMWLLLRRIVMFRADHQDQLAVLEAKCAEVAAVEKRRSDEQMEAAELRLLHFQARLDAVIADRDAWRAAQAAEVQARVAAERAAAQMMEQTNIAVELLRALRQALPKPADIEG